MIFIKTNMLLIAHYTNATVQLKSINSVSWQIKAVHEKLSENNKKQSGSLNRLLINTQYVDTGIIPL